MMKALLIGLLAGAAVLPATAMAQDQGTRDAMRARMQARVDAQGDRRGDGDRPQRDDRGQRPVEAQPQARPQPQQQAQQRERPSGGWQRDRDGRGDAQPGGWQRDRPQPSQVGQAPGRGQWRGDRDANNARDWNDRRDPRGDDRRWNGDRDGRGQVAQGRDWNRGDRNDNRGRNDWNDRGRNDGRGWNRDWRRDTRYDWNRYRTSNRSAYRLPRYYAPYGWNAGYRRFSVGGRLSSVLFAQDYWIQDPYEYRLPEAYGAYRWVRYYNDALLVDIYSGQVVDVINGIFW